ncbi:MAG: transcriptional regulator BldD [Nocardioidaceae bacterium]
MDYAKALGGRLRAIRQQQGLSLQGVEQKSGGRWKAVVIGSYERGDRAVTVQRLSELADFYGVPIEAFLPESDGQHQPAEDSARLVIDLERLKEIRAVEGAPLARYVSTIQAQRGDYNGRVLSIRDDDLRNLSIIYDEEAADLTQKFADWGVVREIQAPHG